MTLPKIAARERGTAYHEAGHAVVAEALHYASSPSRVSIIPNPRRETLGHVLRPGMGRRLRASNKTGEELDSRKLFAEIQVCLAGAIAEQRATGRHSRDGARHDREKAADLALSYYPAGGPTLNALLRWLDLMTRDLVGARWKEIESVARALLEHKRLNREQLRDAMERAHGAESYKAWLELRELGRRMRRARE